MRKIAILDAATLIREGDIDLSIFDQFGEVAIFPTTSSDEISERIFDAEIVLTNKVCIGAEEFRGAKKLKLINVCATGTNIIDFDAARQHEVAICNVAGYSTESVAQHVFTLILNLSTGIHHYAQEAEQWTNSAIFTRLDHPISELHGKTLGIVGYGDIGSAVARIGRAFGMDIIAYQREGKATQNGEVTRLNEDDFFAKSDIVSLHCPLTASTEKFMNRERLGKMKPGSLLINTGRGPLVDSTALLQHLENGHLAGAGLDVLESEPPPSDHPLLQRRHPRLIITPHTAWASLQARQRLIKGLVDNIHSFDKGGTHNRVD